MFSTVHACYTFADTLLHFSASGPRRKGDGQGPRSLELIQAFFFRAMISIRKNPGAAMLRGVGAPFIPSHPDRSDPKDIAGRGAGGKRVGF